MEVSIEFNFLRSLIMFVLVPDYSDGTNNSLKRPYSGPDRLVSPIKKRPIIPQPTPCSSVEHSGLFRKNLSENFGCVLR